MMIVIFLKFHSNHVTVKKRLVFISMCMYVFISSEYLYTILPQITAGLI